MSDKKQIKKAARKVTSTRTAKQQKSSGFWKRVWNIICWPFRKLAQACKAVWNWIRNLELVGLLNLTLLVAIIVLFSMLIMDLTGCHKKNIVVVAETPVYAEQAAAKPVKKIRKAQKIVLPIAQNNAQPVNVVPVKKAEVQIAKKQTPRKNNKLMGDVIIDSRGAGAILQKGMQVTGNLYLQNMRKYTLPCDVRINGNLFLRDVNKLQFCGEFVVTGNIYVSPRSAFGPLPKNARIGGHVVL